MRTTVLPVLLIVTACTKQASSGALGDAPSPESPTRIVAVDSARPPRSVTLQLDQRGYVTVILVAPGHSATLLYPPDSSADNQLGAGSHMLSFQIPQALIQTDSQRMAGIIRSPDSAFGARRSRPRGITPLSPTTRTFLLAISSPQRLSFERLRQITSGVSIPIEDMEALNAIAKAVKGTIANEPRQWAGFYQLVEVRPP